MEKMDLWREVWKCTTYTSLLWNDIWLLVLLLRDECVSHRPAPTGGERWLPVSARFQMRGVCISSQFELKTVVYLNSASPHGCQLSLLDHLHPVWSVMWLVVYFFRPILAVFFRKTNLFLASFAIKLKYVINQVLFRSFLSPFVLKRWILCHLYFYPKDFCLFGSR